MESSEVTYTIGGVKVLFPFKAYPSQLSMMNKIINGVQRSQNCLLESPTGSGKSLALLCSAIAWQRHEEDKRRSQGIDEKERVCTCSCAEKKPPGQTVFLPELPMPSVVPVSSFTPSKPCSDTPVKPALPPDKSCGETPVNLGAPAVTPAASTSKQCNSNGQEDKLQHPLTPVTNLINKEEDEDDDFVPTKKRYRTPIPIQSNKRSKLSKGINYDSETDDEEEGRRNPYTEAYWNSSSSATTGHMTPQNMYKQPDCVCCCHSPQMCCDDDGDMINAKPKKLPKIYFGTRTHKQIAQIVKELGRTAYHDTDMTILGSREHLCVHPTVSTGPNKNEGCKDLLKKRFGMSCKYYNNVHRIKSQWQLDANGLDSAWDIEDLVRVGKREKACPYFAVRGLKDEANIVFCPYNYLIDPKIRKNMDIILKDQIVILDEAHNIEDSSREAASLTVTTEQFEESIAEFDKLIADNWRTNHCIFMRVILVNLLKWIESSANNLNRCDFERESRIWSGVEMVAILHNFNIMPDTIPQIIHHLAAVCEENEKEDQHALSSNSGALLEGLFVIFEYLFRDNMRFMKDYKVALLRTISRKPYTTNQGWMSRRRSNQHSFTLSLNFWCMNPAVAFSDLHTIRSIILTSGTLSPMDSFASELGTTFPIQLEANHVIHKSQIFVSTVAFGLNGHSFNATYKSSESYNFQDEVGNLLFQVCRIIPYGVLMFFPSYSMMSKLEDRWKCTGLWDKLNRLKVVLTEPRGNNKNEFDGLLRQFYDVIKECEHMEQVKDITEPAQNGAIFLAVCRGKVSEGMDFTDNNARVVLTIGIPFPNFKDKQVELKRQYNDKYTSEKGLLTGSSWYEIQAYRALNQALGRCIRHKNDWGSLILVDERYGRNPTKYISGLSKWIRNNVVHNKHAGDLLHSLEEFARERKEHQNESLNVSSVSLNPSQQDVQLNTALVSSTSCLVNSVSTPKQKPTFAALQKILKEKNKQSLTGIQTMAQQVTPLAPMKALCWNSMQTLQGLVPDSPQAVPRTPVRNPVQALTGSTVHVFPRTSVASTTHVLGQTLPQYPVQNKVQTPVQSLPPTSLQNMVQNSKTPVQAFIQPKSTPQTIIVSTGEVAKMFQVQQFLRGADGQLNDVRQYVKLAPYQALTKITDSGIDKLLVIDLPKPVSNVLLPSSNLSLGALTDSNKEVLKIQPAGLVSNFSTLKCSSETNGSYSNDLSSTLSTNSVLKETVETSQNQMLTSASNNLNDRKENGSKKAHIKIEYEEQEEAKTDVSPIKNTDLNSNLDDLKNLKKKTTPYKFVDIPEKIKPCDNEGTPDLFDTESLLSPVLENDTSPVLENERSTEGLNTKLMLNDKSHPLTRKKLFKSTGKTDIKISDDTKNEENKNRINEEGDDSSESPLVITRRTRRRKLESGQDQKKGDILDDLDNPGRVGSMTIPCFEELFCSLHHQLSPNLEGLTKVHILNIKSNFLKDCLRNIQLSLSPASNSVQCMCQCPGDKRSITDQYILYGHLVPDNMTGFSNGQPQLASGFSYNSYWSEEDCTCYQPLFCDECWKQNPESNLIGVKEVKRSNNSNQDIIWLFTQHLNVCHHAIQEMPSNVT